MTTSAREFAFADLRGLVDDDGKLTNKEVGYKIKSKDGSWVNAHPSDDQKYLVNVGGGCVRAKRKYYADTWGAVGPCIVSESIPFAKEPSNSIGKIWAVRLGQTDSWALARLGVNGILYQMRGVSKDSTAGKIVMDKHGDYGTDYGEVLLAKDHLGSDKLHPNSILVKHPAIKDDWYPAYRKNNNWWIDCGTMGQMKVHDASVGMINSENMSWKNLQR